MNTQLQTTTEAGLVPADVTPMDLQAALAGDLKRLTPEGRLKFYGAMCQSVGINPLTKPFEWLEFQGKLVLYANKGCAEQLRKLHGVSIEVVDRKVEFGCLIVRVKATSKDGRCDEGVGAVPFNERNAAEAAIAMMKCETKAKRRVTLSICGLGLLDESELDTMRENKSVVTAINGEESAASRAEILNSALTSGEKEKAVEAEVVNEPVKVEPVVETQTTPVQEAAVEAPKEQPQRHPMPHGITPAPTASTSPDDKLLKLEEAMNIFDDNAFPDFSLKAACDWLRFKKKLEPGALIGTTKADAVEWIISNPARFHKTVDQWVQGGRK